jgi:hypothetical protein
MVTSKFHAKIIEQSKVGFKKYVFIQKPNNAACKD